jgi:threonine aldolase
MKLKGKTAVITGASGQLGSGIARIKGLSIDLPMVQTNIIYFDLDDKRITAERLTSQMSKKGILFFSTGPDRFRMVTHYGIESEDIETTISSLKQIMKS